MRLVPLFTLAVLVSGCDEWKFEMTTRIDPAARLTRETRITHSGDSKGEMIDSRFRLPTRARVLEKTDDRVVLELAAASPRDLEPDFVARLPAETGRRDPRNAVEWARRDCVFFDHYTYREQFRDSVDEAERAAATDRLADMLRDLALAAAALETEGRYDLSRLEAWLDGAGRRLVEDLVRIATTEKNDTRREERFLARLGAEGIAAGEEGLGDALARFAGERLHDLLVPKEGTSASYDPASLLEKDAEGKTRLEERLAAASLALHGSKEKADKALEEAFRAVAGDVNRAPIAFHARVEMPGRVLRTNGVIEDEGGPGRDGRAFWDFTANDVATTGHALELETIVPKPEALARPLGADEILRTIRALEKLDDAARARLAEAVASVGDERPVKEVREALPEPLRTPFDTLVEVRSGGKN